MVCKRCRKDYDLAKRSNGRRNYCSSCLVWRYRNNLKKKAVALKGGKCSKCGYDKCLSALQFHHLDPSKKDFSVSTNTNKSWNETVKELDKCILLCANCHCEEHELLRGSNQGECS